MFGYLPFGFVPFAGDKQEPTGGDAISFVGSGAVAQGNTTSALTFNFSSLLNSAGGTPTVLAGDVVVIFTHMSAGQSQHSPCVVSTTGYTTLLPDAFGNDTVPISTSAFYKVMGSTPDTSVVLAGLGAVKDVQSIIVYVFRGVNTTAPVVWVTSASGLNGGQADPPAINPNPVTGSWIVAGGGGALDAAMNVYTVPSNATNTTNYFRSAMGNGNINYVTSGGAIYTGWTSGSFDMAAFGGTTNADIRSGWGAVTVALRPGPTPVLVIQGAASASVADNVTLAPKTALAVNGAASASVADNVTLAPKTALVVDAASSASVVDNVTLAPKTVLVVANAVSASLVDNITLAPKTALVVADAPSASVTDNVILAPKTALTVAAAASASLVDNVTLTPRWALTVANASSASTASNVVLVVGTLQMQNASSASTADNVTLTPQTALVVANASSASTVENIALAAKTALTVANATSASLVDSFTLTVKTALVVDSASSASTATTIALTPRWAVTVQNASSASTVDSFTLAAKTTLVISNPVSLSEASSPAVAGHTQMYVQDGASLSSATTVVITPKWQLSTDHALSLSQSTTVTLAPKTQLAPADASSASTVTSLVLFYQLLLIISPAVSLSASTTVALGYTVITVIPPTRKRIVFRYNDPESINVPKLNQLAYQAQVPQRDVLTLYELSVIAPTMGLEAHCWDATGGYTPVYADGTNWRRTADNTILN